MLPAGAVLAGYRIERVLGIGGMGTVYLARNATLPRLDALKVLSAELSRNDEFRSRFVREADVAARLDHPNIVSIYRRGETDDGQLWIAMTYVEGTDADDALRAGTMNAARAVHIVSDIAAALDYAHQRNVVHRDIKPANFLLGFDGKDERALLADFGIARALDDVGLTATNSVMATVAYAAPEVLAGVRFDHRADLYSLGCTLFRLLTGKTPFPGDAGVPAVMLAHMQQPPPRVTDWRPDLPPALNNVIATALAKDPADRFATAGELAAAARASLHGPTASTTAPWQAIPGPAVSPYAGPANTAWFTPGRDPRTQIGSPPAHSSPVYQRSPRKPRRRGLIAVSAAVILVSAGGATVAVTTHHSDGATATAPVAPTTTAKPVPKTALGNLLLNADEVGTIMGGTLVAGSKEAVMSADSDSMVEKDCAAPDSPRELRVYQGSGWQAVAAQGLKENFDRTQLGRVGTQSVVSFLTADLAADFANNQKAVWARCSNAQYTEILGQVDGKDVTALIGLGTSHTDSDGILSILVTPQGREGWACGRGLVARNNVVVDVIACSHENQETQAINITKQISTKIGLVE